MSEHVMDPSNPIRALAPGVRGDVLRVLAGAHRPLTGQRVQHLSGRSYAAVRDSLLDLVAHGLAATERYGNAHVYWLNRDHLLADAVERAVAALTRLNDRLAAEIAAWRPRPAAVWMFGSYARRDGDRDSDIDMLLLRPDEIAEDGEAWAGQRFELTRLTKRLTGNAVQIVEYSESEFAQRLGNGDRFVLRLLQDVVVLYGPRPSEWAMEGGIPWRPEGAAGRRSATVPTRGTA